MDAVPWVRACFCGSDLAFGIYSRLEGVKRACDPLLGVLITWRIAIDAIV
jgi:hypothetical protein